MTGEALALATKLWGDQALRRLFVSDFDARESGELFLYVNDAVQIVPFLGQDARILLQRSPLALPPTSPG